MNRKAVAQRIHAKRRILERFGIAVNNRDLTELGQKIRAGDAEFHSRQSHRVSKWIIQNFYAFPGPIFVVYDSLRKNVVTVMPFEETHEYRRYQNGGES